MFSESLFVVSNHENYDKVKSERFFLSKDVYGAVVVAHLVEQLLPTPKVPGPNPIIGHFFMESIFSVKCIEEAKIYKKESGNGPSKM